MCEHNIRKGPDTYCAYCRVTELQNIIDNVLEIADSVKTVGDIDGYEVWKFLTEAING